MKSWDLYYWLQIRKDKLKDWKYEAEVFCPCHELLGFEYSGFNLPDGNEEHETPKKEQETFDVKEICSWTTCKPSFLLVNTYTVCSYTHSFRRGS